MNQLRLMNQIPSSMPRGRFFVLAIVIGLAGCSGSPNSPEVKLERARILMERDQAAEAIPLLNEVVDATPKDPEARYQRGVAYESLDVLEKALADYTECLVLDQDRTDALNNKAVVLARMKRFEEAAVEFSRLVDLDPQGPLAYRNRGLCYFDLKQYDAALADYAKALELAPEEPACWFQRAGVYLAQNRFEEADQDYSKAIKLDPELAKAWMNRGVARYRRGQKDLAAEDLKRAQSLDDNIVLPAIDFFANETTPAADSGWSAEKSAAEKELGDRGFSSVKLVNEYPAFRCAAYAAVYEGDDWTIVVGTQAENADTLTLPPVPSDTSAIGLLILKTQAGTTTVIDFQQPWKPAAQNLEPVLVRYPASK